MPRVYPKVVVRRNVSNQSSRRGARPNQIGVHTTESGDVKGIGDLANMAAYFDRPEVEASSTVIVDLDGTSARCMPDEAKPWTQAAYNTGALTIEQIARASYSRSVWMKRTPELDETARWIAYWSNKWGIPAKHLLDPKRSGVFGHKAYGLAGGGHVDPGPHYPWRYVMARARLYKAAQRRRKNL